MPVKRKKHATGRQIQEAIYLLTNTDDSYEKISKQTKVSTSKIVQLGKQFRSEEKRQRLRTEGQNRGTQMLSEKAKRRAESQSPRDTETEVVPSHQQLSIEEILSPEGTITRNVAFKYSSEGKGVEMDEFIEELNSLIITLEESGNVLVDFSFTVQAE